MYQVSRELHIASEEKSTGLVAIEVLQLILIQPEKLRNCASTGHFLITAIHLLSFPNYIDSLVEIPGANTCLRSLVSPCLTRWGIPQEPDGASPDRPQTH